MKKHLSAFLFLAMLACLPASAQIRFVVNGETKTTSPHCIYVTPKKKSNVKNHVFATVNEALRSAEKNADSGEWTDIYIEPSVYWIDNPDDPAIRRSPKGGTPFGMEVSLSNTRLIGLSSDPQDVVFASNRGQTQGADGNFTMLHITGDNVEAYNITFGNYCNVDLVYPRNPKLNRARRKDAIVQAQLVICKGDNYKVDNCRFISRLNLCPFAGAQHIDFTNSYFECTDDALCGTGTYKKCRFTFYSSKPFYSTYNQGATFIDCDIHSKTHGVQYLTKVSGPVKMENCRWTSEDENMTIEWTRRPDPRNYCVMTGCTLNGKPLVVPTPTEPLPVALPPVAIANQTEIIPGRWTVDAYKPSDTAEYAWSVNNDRPAWGYAEGVDGAEGSWGMTQIQKGARLMYTPKDDTAVDKQTCTITLDPCKGPGQGFGSATGQYLDICIKFDTRSLTGYGLRFIRTPEYDHSVETYLVEYQNGNIIRISEPQRCDLFKPGCSVTLTAEGATFVAEITNDKVPDAQTQKFAATMANPNKFGGFHLQHTGSTGASATIVKTIFLK